jgi:hypothetical protein
MQDSVKREWTVGPYSSEAQSGERVGTMVDETKRGEIHGGPVSSVGRKEDGVDG